MRKMDGASSVVSSTDDGGSVRHSTVEDSSWRDVVWSVFATDGTASEWLFDCGSPATIGAVLLAVSILVPATVLYMHLTSVIPATTIVSVAASMVAVTLAVVPTTIAPLYDGTGTFPGSTSMVGTLSLLGSSDILREDMIVRTEVIMI